MSTIFPASAVYDTIETDQHARIWLRWNKEFDTISASEEDFSEFAGRTVIIGMTAEGLNSIIATPLGEMHDYILSASTLQTVLDGDQINRYDYSLFLELIISIVLGVLIVLLSRFTPYWFIGLTIVLSYVILVFTSYYLFTEYLILADVSWAIICLTIVGMHSIFNRFVLEFQLKQQIRKQFETYLDPRQVALLQKDPSKLVLGGDRREMSFLFMDIIVFTPISAYYKNKDYPAGLVTHI